MTHRKPIAFADPSGQVFAPVYNRAPSDFARENLLTPLYTQEEIEASLARFEAAQDAQSAEAPTLYGDFDEEVAAVNAEAEARAKTGKRATGTSVAEAAKAALAAAGNK